MFNRYFGNLNMCYEKDFKSIGQICVAACFLAEVVAELCPNDVGLQVHWVALSPAHSAHIGASYFTMLRARPACQTGRENRANISAAQRHLELNTMIWSLKSINILWEWHGDTSQSPCSWSAASETCQAIPKRFAGLESVTGLLASTVKIPGWTALRISDTNLTAQSHPATSVCIDFSSFLESWFPVSSAQETCTCSPFWGKCDTKTLRFRLRSTQFALRAIYSGNICTCWVTRPMFESCRECILPAWLA